MKLVRSIREGLYLETGCVLTIGNFDGVHLGHQAIVCRLVEQAKLMELPAVLMTFSPSPQEFFRGIQATPRLTPVSSRYLHLLNSGIDVMIALPFNRSLAQTSARDFIQKYIVQGLNTRYLFVGDDFRFGAGRQGDYQLLSEIGKISGYAVERFNTVEDDGRRISSTRIRQALGVGDLNEVARLTGRRFSIIGRVAHGDKRGRQWGFPTLNLPLRRCPPMTGVYAVTAQLQDGRKIKGIANLGNRPTVDGSGFLLETHLFDFSEEIYGWRICVEFVEKIREEMKFESFEAIRRQIIKDCEMARKLYSSDRFYSCLNP